MTSHSGNSANSNSDVLTPLKLQGTLYYTHYTRSLFEQLSTEGYKRSLCSVTTSFNVQHSTMSPVLPFDIIALIIDIVAENKDKKFLNELALVSNSFLHICRKHLFATVELHDAFPGFHIASSKKEFLKLLESRPHIVEYIRKLTYKVGNNVNSPKNDYRLLPILRTTTIPHLNCLTITASHLDWNELDSSLTSAFLHLMHLPTINHIDLSSIVNFPLSSLTPSVNLHRLDIFWLFFYGRRAEADGGIVVLSEMLPKIREFHI
jgi:hypothetical protein